MGRVVVVARLQLVAQAVAAALRERGVEADVISWHQAAQRPDRKLTHGDVLVLLDDLVSVQDVEATCRIISRARARCVLLTRRPEGPAWGALLEAGAAAVLTPECPLEEVSATVKRVGRGEPLMGGARRAALLSAWEAWKVDDQRLRARLARLSPRERQVLLLLSQGNSVVDIIDTLGVAEATVRSQIKSMRRKLGVQSQLGAVALLHQLGQGGELTPRSGSPVGL